MLKLFNTYSKSSEVFQPLATDGTVTLYTCGPTVYSYAHIGNFRSFLMADVLRRVLERRKYTVHQAMNITDVGHMTEDHLADATGEDKLAKAARELGRDPYEVARHFERAFMADAATLRLRIYSGDEATNPRLHPRATAYVAEMLAMIQRLLERGFAYVDSIGQVYFDVAKFPEYGRLSGKVLEDLTPGARVAVREEKKDPRDFALWKRDDKHLMQWDPHSENGWPDDGYQRLLKLAPNGIDARIGRGFPGWHIECSAMTRAELGPVIDLHTGGEDNIFPHHECEIAQSYGASELPDPPPTFARYWVHGRHLLVNGVKMSKRDGTLYTLRDLLDPRSNNRTDLAEELERAGFKEGRVPANVLRYALTSTPFGHPMNFTFDVLVQARASVDRLQSFHDRLRERAEPGDASTEVTSRLVEFSRAFDDALDDNLNVSRALAELFAFVSEFNKRTLPPADAMAVLTAFQDAEQVFDTLDRQAASGLFSTAELAGCSTCVEVVPEGELGTEVLLGLLAGRAAARRRKDFATADQIRGGLKERGIEIEDVSQGVRWRRES
jgi:cysteinyl-tRNA synthetase